MEAFTSTLGLLTHSSVRTMLLYPIWSLSSGSGLVYYFSADMDKKVAFFFLNFTKQRHKDMEKKSGGGCEEKIFFSVSQVYGGFMWSIRD